MGDGGGRQDRPSGTPIADPSHQIDEPKCLPRSVGVDRSLPLTDPMRFVRYERQQASAQIARSLKTWRKGKNATDSRPTNIPKDGGEPLPAQARETMEQRLDANLGHVKIHTGGDSSAAAGDLHARAFTVGNDVHFGSGEFQPGTKDGDKLIAHELTHVVQGQKAGVQRKSESHDGAGGDSQRDVSHPDEPAEKEADSVSDRVANELHDGGHQGKSASRSKGENRPARVSASHIGGSAAEHTQDKDAHEGELGGAKSDGAVQRKPGRGSAGLGEREIEKRAVAGIASGGGALPHREEMERGFETSFADVRLHTGPRAADASRAIGAEAYTVGNQIAVADPAPSRGLIAHELAHVVQQRAGAGPAGGVGRAGDRFEREADAAAAQVTRGEKADIASRHDARSSGGAVQRQAVQKYDSFEHARAGDDAAQEPGSQAADKLDAKTVEKAKVYNAKRATDVSEFNALTGHACARDGVVDPARVHAWQSANGLAADGMVGPKTVAKARSLGGKNEGKLIIQGVEVTRGEINALGDFYATLDDLMKANPAELTKLVALIRKQKDDPKSVSEADWDSATGGRYNDLNLKNSKHFAPSNSELIPKQQGAPAGNDNRSVFEQHHRQALELARLASTQNGPEGKKTLERARITNSFAEHYLLDAFSAGHLFNKDDLVGLVRQNLKGKKQIDTVLTAVATTVFAKHGARISNFRGKKYGTWWDVDSADRFKGVIEGIYEERPDVVDSAIAKAAHDALNERKEGGAVGVPVENDFGQWVLSGDRTLADSPKTQMWMQKAMECARENLSIVSQGNADLAVLLKRVQAYLPRPSQDSTKLIHNLVEHMTDVKDGGMAGAISEVLNNEIDSILDVLVRRGYLKKKS